MSTNCSTPETLIIAFDIGKNVHWLGCYDGQLHVLIAPHKLGSDLAGFQAASAEIDSLLSSGRFRQAVLGHECTGPYHEPWAWQIQAHYAAALRGETACPLAYRWLNARLTRRRQDQSSVHRRSTDKLAVQAIAECLAHGLGQPAPALTPAQRQLREQVLAWEQLTAQQRFLTDQLLPQIERLWPGAIVNRRQFQAAHPELPVPQPIVQSRPFERQRVLGLFLACPDPYEALALGPAGLRQRLQQQGVRIGPAGVDAILQLVRRAPLAPPAVAAIYAQRLQADFEAYGAIVQRLRSLEAAIANGVDACEARFPDSVPGIGALLASRYVVHVGQIERFPSAAHIWSFAGFDPLSQESGDRRQVGSLSKRGNPALRDTLFQIGQHTAHACPSIGLTYLRALERGLSTVAATIHAAHKANRLCFTLWSERRLYQPAAAPVEAEFRQRHPPRTSTARRPPQRIAA